MSLENKINAESKTAEPKTIKQVSKFKIVIKTLAVIMFIYGFSLTFSMPQKLYGLSYVELGSLANGHVIEDVDAMFNFLGIRGYTDVKNLTDTDITNMKNKAEGAIENSIVYTCTYWFVCASLLFVHIKDKEIAINQEVKEEKNTEDAKKS